jgi:hypothetical protein
MRIEAGQHGASTGAAGRRGGIVLLKDHSRGGQPVEMWRAGRLARVAADVIAQVMAVE